MMVLARNSALTSLYKNMKCTIPCSRTTYDASGSRGSNCVIKPLSSPFHLLECPFLHAGFNHRQAFQQLQVYKILQSSTSSRKRSALPEFKKKKKLKISLAVLTYLTLIKDQSRDMFSGKMGGWRKIKEKIFLV